MTDMEWTYFVLGLIAWQVSKAVSLIVKDEYKNWKDKRFLKFVRVEFPEKTFVYMSIASTNRKALKQLKEAIQTGHYVEVTAEEDAYRTRDR